MRSTFSGQGILCVNVQGSTIPHSRMCLPLFPGIGNISADMAASLITHCTRINNGDHVEDFHPHCWVILENHGYDFDYLIATPCQKVVWEINIVLFSLWCTCFFVGLENKVHHFLWDNDSSVDCVLEIVF